MASAHNAVRGLAVFFGELALVVALLVAQDPQRLGALQFYLKLLRGRREELRDNGAQAGLSFH